MEVEDNICEYHPEVYRKDWRYGIGEMAGYHKGLRHGVLLALASWLIATAWLGFLQWIQPR